MTSKRKTKQLRWLVTMILLVTAMAMPKMAWAEITPQQPSGDGTSANPYQIGTPEELYWFAGLVNGDDSVCDYDADNNPTGTQQNNAACAKLTANIVANSGLTEGKTMLESLEYDASGNVTNGSSFVAWTPIGNLNITYTGTFDGQGHTISGLYFKDSNTSNVGLFVYNSGTIKNVGVVDSYFYGKNYVGGVCGHNTGTITGCYNKGTVSGSANYVGGVCGRNSLGTITGCNNTGKVSGYQYVGGVCGYNVNKGKITGCYNTGTVSSPLYYVGGVCGENDGGTITGCYNTGTVSGNDGVGGVCGANYTGGTITGCYNTGTVSGSDSYVGGVCGQNSSGTITYCYYLSGKATGGISSNNVAGSAEAKTTTEFASGDVYSLLNTALQKAKASVRFYQGANYPELIMNVPSLVEGVYQITNKEELYAFALLVNKKVDVSANAVLTADITVNTALLASLNEDGSIKEDGKTVETWTPIGNLTLKYTGIFDGQEHTISGLYFNNSNVNNVGLFGYNKGTIKNVGVVDSYFKGHNSVGGVCGYNVNGGKITGCYNKGTVRGYNMYVGGVCGHNSSGTITGCHNTGTVSGKERVGGVCGGNSNGGTITDCYNKGTVSGSDISYVGGVCGDNNGGTITDCYNEGEVSAGGSGSYVGGVCGHNVNEGKITGCYNTRKVSGKGWASDSGSYVGGVCGYNEGGTITGCYNTGDVSGIGTINSSSPSANYVLGSYVGGVCGANSGIITDCYNKGTVSGTGTVSGGYVGRSYVLGSYVGGVCGYNDGGKITGCNNTGEVSGKEEVGDTGEVSGTGTVSGSYVGGVCGRNDNKGTITGCYNTGTVRGSGSGSDSGKYVGGVCGYNYGGTITGCYSTGSVSGSGSYVGGVCGFNSGGTITGCYNIGTVSGSGSFVGGVCGFNSGGTITSCYYNRDKFTGNAVNNEGGKATDVEGKTTTQFANGEVCTLLNTALKNENASVRFYKGANYPEIINLPSIDDKGVYQISNKDELYAFALVVNNVDASAKAVLTANITVNTDLLTSLNEDGSIKDGNTIETWTPVGNNNIPYTGTFDGQGHTISGLYFKDSNTIYVGLFGYNSGTIKNVGVVDSYFCGNSFVGGVCGQNYGTITGCSNTGEVSGSDVYVGGVCGYNVKGGKITGCYNKGEVSGSGNNVGGVCGYNGGTITGCNNTGTVRGDNMYVGGVCGLNNGGTIAGCYNTGSVSGDGSSVGGVCGTNDGGTITGCYYDNVKCTIMGIHGSDVSGQAQGKSTTQFQIGEVCYLLNGSSPYGEWGQQIGTDDYPIISSAYKVLRAAQDGQEGTNYWATFSNRNSNAELMASTGEITVYNATVSGGTLTLTKRSDNKVALGEGVLLKANCEYVNAMNISDEVSAAATGENHLVATPSDAGTITADEGYKLYRLTYKNSTEKTGLGFYLGGVKNAEGTVISDGTTLKVTPGKAYLRVADSALGTAPIRGFVIGEDDNTTGIDVITINGIDTNDSKVDDSVYDLMGRKVSKPAKGIYIKNGKKVIIK